MSLTKNTMSFTNEPSICIPRTFDTFDWRYIMCVFEEVFGEGTIQRVDVVPKTDKNGQRYSRVFVHFKRWPIDHQEMRYALLNGKELKINYDGKWYWKCSASYAKRPEKKRRPVTVEIIGETKVNPNTNEAKLTKEKVTEAKVTKEKVTEEKMTEAKEVKQGELSEN